MKKKYKQILKYFPEEHSSLSTHCLQVTKLALQLFKKTCSLHQLGKEEKKYLTLASLLHDIGYSIDAISHNKSSSKFIIKNAIPHCRKKEKKVIACIARYHRGAFPKETHKIFGKLSARKQRAVKILSSLLRIADGLDYTHQNSVKSLEVYYDEDRIIIEVSPRKGSNTAIDIERARKKSDLFLHIFPLKEIVIIEKKRS